MKGRKPVPTQLNKIRGNPGKRAVNVNEPVAAIVGEEYPCPAHLSGIAEQCWSDMIRLLAGARVITELDLKALELYCQSYQTYREAQEALAESGPIVQSPKSGYPVQSPFFAIANKSQEQMMKIAAEFGMTPSSRTRVSAVEAPKKTNRFLDS